MESLHSHPGWSRAPVCLSPTCPHPDKWLCHPPCCSAQSPGATPDSPLCPLPPSPPTPTGKSQGFPQHMVQSPCSLHPGHRVSRVISPLGSPRSLIRQPEAEGQVLCLTHCPTPHPTPLPYTSSVPASLCLCLCLCLSLSHSSLGLMPSPHLYSVLPELLPTLPSSFLPSALMPPALSPARSVP